jgi:hypothetical protein
MKRILAFNIVAFLILAAMGSQFSCSCQEEYEFVAPLTVSNRTSEPVDIYVKPVDETETEFAYVGQVPAKKTVKFLNSRILRHDLRDVLIEARLEDGTVIFSKIFTVDELEALKLKITIQ